MEDKTKIYKIWFRRFNKDGEHIGSGVMPHDYKHRSSAIRAAKKLNQSGTQWIVSQDNPFFRTDESQWEVK